LEKVSQEGDRELLRQLIEKQARLTQSHKALRILKEWNAAIEKFVKVIPVEYKKILELRQTANSVSSKKAPANG